MIGAADGNGNWPFDVNETQMVCDRAGAIPRRRDTPLRQGQLIHHGALGRADQISLQGENRALVAPRFEDPSIGRYRQSLALTF